MRFDLPATLLEELRAWRDSRPQDPVEHERDAFCLDPGLGPAYFLTVGGRVLVDATCWDGTPIREASDAESLAAIVVGARKTGLAKLLDLLPRAPDGAPTCDRCGGDRYAPLVAGHPESATFVCPDCHGVGWTAAE
jgi:hypothetical protein